MISLRALWYGCLLNGHAMLRERSKGRYSLVCTNCGHVATFPRQRLRIKRTERGTSKALRFPTKVKQA